MRITNILSLLAATGALSSPVPADIEQRAALEKRASQINHDAVRSIDPAVSNDAEGRAMKQFQPTLMFVAGCWSFPAVDASGNWGGGLKPSGGKTSGCWGNSNGQTYVRSAWHREKYGMMYCWYFPKDQTDFAFNPGDRHDWECAIVWINNLANPQAQGIMTSAHGGWKRWDVVNPWNIDGSAFKVKYFQDVKVFGTHALDITGDGGGGKSPLIQYELLPAPARNSLNNVNWESANFIMKDPSFRANLEAAYPFAKNGPCRQC